MAPIPQFGTERLILRGVTEQDIPAYEKHFVDYEVIRQMAVVPWPYPSGGVTRYFRDVIEPNQGKDQWIWGIFLKSHPEEVIGAVTLRRQGTPGNRGFWLGRQYWGRGIMTEAVAPVLEYAFMVLDFKTLLFSNAVGNTRSRRVKEKTGAVLLWVQPADYVSPEYTEREVWELTKEQWLASEVKTA